MAKKEKKYSSLAHGQFFWGMLVFISLSVMLFASVQARRHPEFARAQTGQQQADSGQPEAGGDFPGQGDTLMGNSVVGEDGLLQNAQDAGEDGRAQEGNAPSASLAGDSTAGDGVALADSSTAGDETAFGDVSSGDDADFPGDAPVIALTFDDGPFTKVTNRIVDVLLEYNAGATFFVVGSRIEMYSDTLKRVYDSGFEIANHTWSHKDLGAMGAEEIAEEVRRTEEALKEHVPVENVLVRPPYGSVNDTVRSVVEVPMINWSLDSEDWKTRDTDAIIEHVLATVKDGDVILMHDLYECTAAAIEYLVPELVARGYRLVSVSELFAIKGKELEGGGVYRNAIN